MSLNTNSPNAMGQSSNNAGDDDNGTNANANDEQEGTWTGQHQTRSNANTVPKCNLGHILDDMKLQLFHWKICT